MVKLKPAEELIPYAAQDRLRLTGSPIAGKDALLRMLRFATDTLHLPREAVADDPPNPTQWPTQNDKNLAEARETLQYVRHSVNEFRDDSWEGLIQTRNKILESVIFAGAASYIFLVLVILTGALRQAVWAATVFFMVGAAVGLFNRLRIDKGDPIRVDDYGSWHVRLVQTPVLSGLAALAGVVLFALIPSALNAEAVTPQQATPTPTMTATTSPVVTRGTATTVATAISTRASEGQFSAFVQVDTATATPTAGLTTTRTPTPTHSATAVPSTATATATSTPLPGAAAPPKRIPKLEEIFSLHGNLFGLIVAATFGLTPTLVVGALQKQINRYNIDIKSTEAQEGGS